MEHSQQWPRVGAILWSFCFQFLLAEQIARLGWPAHYSMAHDYISDLGSGRSPLHSVMNGSFILQGFLIFFGAVLVSRLYPATLVYRIALALLAAAGLGVLVVGVFPEDVHVRIHSLGAIENFLTGNLGMILLGLANIRKNWAALAAGSVGMLATLSLIFHGGGAIGTVERIAAYPLPLWLTWTGAVLYLGLSSWQPPRSSMRPSR
jgi:hypothetical membrane protein